MYVVIRSYSGEGATDVFDTIEERVDEVRGLFTEVPGFVSYTAFRTSDGGAAVTVCQDKEGTDESTRIAARWVLENVSMAPPVPTVTEGSTVVQAVAD